MLKKKHFFSNCDIFWNDYHNPVKEIRYSIINLIMMSDLSISYIHLLYPEGSSELWQHC